MSMLSGQGPVRAHDPAKGHRESFVAGARPPDQVLDDRFDLRRLSHIHRCHLFGDPRIRLRDVVRDPTPNARSKPATATPALHDADAEVYRGRGMKRLSRTAPMGVIGRRDAVDHIPGILIELIITHCCEIDVYRAGGRHDADRAGLGHVLKLARHGSESQRDIRRTA